MARLWEARTKTTKEEDRLKDDVIRILHANAVDCPSCKRVMPTHTFFCSNCGSPLSVEHRSFIKAMWMVGMTAAGMAAAIAVTAVVLSVGFLSIQIRDNSVENKGMMLQIQRACLETST